MGDNLSQLEPRSIWSHFSAIAEIPRPSKHEKQIRDWVRSVADQHGFKSATDREGNIVVDVPASPGREQAPVVVIQGHLDMVCEKNPDASHDFMHDPIQTVIDGDWVKAKGTTLGADNGIGVAAALAAATDPAVNHGPLQLLFTVDEETGLTGAARLDPSLIHGRVLLNLDSEEDGNLCVGCAGGADSILTVTPAFTAPTPGNRAYRLTVAGLSGGHSGSDIHENRGNAVKLLVRTLVHALDSRVTIELAELKGGGLRNAIPRNAEALFFLNEKDVDRFRKALGQIIEEFRSELPGIDDELEIQFSPAQHAGQAMERESRNRLLQLLMVLPHGVMGMSREIPGLVETSSNLASVEIDGENVQVTCSSRSSIAASLEAVLAAIRSAGALAEFEVRSTDSYPGWKPDMNSAVLKVVRKVYAELWQRDPEVSAIHAGLECGLLGERISGLDMISFGPEILGAHSPDERANIPSVKRFWDALSRVLDELSRPGGPQA